MVKALRISGQCSETFSATSFQVPCPLFSETSFSRRARRILHPRHQRQISIIPLLHFPSSAADSEYVSDAFPIYWPSLFFILLFAVFVLLFCYPSSSSSSIVFMKYLYVFLFLLLLFFLVWIKCFLVFFLYVFFFFFFFFFLVLLFLLLLFPPPPPPPPPPFSFFFFFFFFFFFCLVFFFFFFFFFFFCLVFWFLDRLLQSPPLYGKTHWTFLFFWSEERGKHQKNKDVSSPSNPTCLEKKGKPLKKARKFLIMNKTRKSPLKTEKCKVLVFL